MGHIIKISPVAVEMPLSTVGIRDSSLTTLKRKQRALAAWRATSGFPVNGSARPEQAGAQPQATSDVSVNARQGAALLNCCSSALDDGYGKQAPATGNNHNF